VDSRMLATDLDGTFIGDHAAMMALWADLETAGITLAFSTGRHLPSIEAFYAEAGTDRRAHACVCMVGTELWVGGDDGYSRDDEWSRRISADWDRERVAAIVAAQPGATEQPGEWQSEFKSSWFLEEDSERAVAAIREALDAAGLRAKVIYSAGRFLDLLPVESGKGEAVRYLAARLSIPADNVITSGDTGNDLDMMRPELGFRSIAVGNAAPELRDYRAAGIYHAAASYAAGIREGLVHYGWLER
jgi:sucrose-6F-phosphate phosphohydrolase